MTFWPDETIFDEVEFRAQTVVERLQMMAFLNRNLEINFTDERPGHEQLVSGSSTPGGIEDFVSTAYLNQSKEPLFKKVCYFNQSETDQEVEVALQWNESYNESIHSFANGISTIEGDMHEEGLKKALTNIVNRYARTKNALRESDANFQGEDIREGLTGILSVRLREPQFEGQTKAKLGNVAMRSLVERATNEKLGIWFEENPKEANQIVQKALARRSGSPCRNAPGTGDLLRGESHL